MTCVGYDEQFVRVLEANAHRFVSFTRKNASEGNTTNTFKRPRNTLKRPRMSERVDGEDVEHSSEGGWHDESDPMEVTSTIRRSTRARVKRVRTSWYVMNS